MYKCPICNQSVESQFTGITSIVNCPSFCFSKLDKKYPKCPICKEGYLSETTYHGEMYKRCSNSECKFELDVDSVIALAMEEK